MSLLDRFFQKPKNSTSSIETENKTMSDLIKEADLTEISSEITTEGGEGNYQYECGKVVFLNWCNKSGLDTDYPNYFKYTYNIRNLKSLHRSFIKDGYLRPTNEYESFETLTIPILKQCLKDNNLELKGNKPDLINRLLEKNIKPPKIDKYVLTEKGNDYLEENKLWLDFHRNYTDISFKDFKDKWDELKASKKDISFYDIVEPIMKKNLESYRRKRLYTSYKLKLFPLANILNEQDKLKEYTNCILEMICIDLSGLNDSSFKYSDTFRPWPSIQLLENQIIDLSKNLKYYSESKVDEIFENLKLQEGALNPSEMKSVINLALNDFEKAQNLVVEFNKENQLFSI